MSATKRLIQKDKYRWEIPQDYKPGMNVPGMLYADDEMLAHIKEDEAVEQVANVATLPGIVSLSLAMPDIHWGYGFPIGGVAATRVSDGVISPGGVGFDINCGVRLLRTNLTEEEVRPKIDKLVDALYHNVPSGVGSEGKLRLKPNEVDDVLRNGARWAVEKGYGERDDIEVTEERGCMSGADPGMVSARARQRGGPQLGTLGSGNHFLEVQVVEEIYEAETARAMGVTHAGQVLLLIHTGSRGLGYQVCEDYVKGMGAAVRKYGIELPDRQLACAPVNSQEGKDYYAAMACAANYAWANRQCITHWARESFMRVLRKGSADLGMEMIYDVAHNIAKMEKHDVGGKRIEVCVHRKGATRSLPAGHPDVPSIYADIGQPVLIPGDMGRYSFVLVGTERALSDTFGSTCHGAGRLLSRTAAKKGVRGSDVAHRLEADGIKVRTASISSLAEEASEAYKDVAQVVEVTHRAGLSRKVAKMRPIGVIKG
jgi:tRNA-splicing ligase RtcB